MKSFLFNTLTILVFGLCAMKSYFFLLNNSLASLDFLAQEEKSDKTYMNFIDKQISG